MDGTLLALFLLATFLGGFVSGFSGFAMGIVVSGIWLHIITPIQTATLIAGYGLLTLRFGVGVLLVLYAIYSLARPAFRPMKIGTAADIVIGFFNGLLGGLTGLGGVISTISCQLRGWSKDMQRAVFQPVLFAAFVIISISQLVAG